VPIQVEQIDVNLFSDTYNANKIKLFVNEMRIQK